MTVDLAQYKDLFVSEVQENIAALSDAVLVIERDSTQKRSFDDAMRLAHTIKGSAATMGYQKMAFLAHVLEDVFSASIAGLLVLDTPKMSVILSGIDAMGTSLDSIVKTDKEEDTEAVANSLKELTGVQTSGTGKTQKIEVAKTRTKRLLAKESQGEDHKKAPVDDQEPAAPVPPVVAIEETVAKPLTSDTGVWVDRRESDLAYIKVPVARLDSLMGLMEEMLAIRMKLQMIADPATRHAKDPSFILLKKAFPLIGELHPLVDGLDRVVTETQYQIMRARMVPVGQIFGRFPRMIRDVAISQGKQINFIVDGSDIELDRSVVDKLGQPLIHLLRNAVDHGIKVEGTIRLTVVRERDHALVTVEDDGEGLNHEAIRRTIISKGLLEASVAERLTQRELVSYIFRPYFSTNTEVTAISGRGVGMSAVKGFVEEMGGRIMVVSPVTNQGGTRFVLRLPFSVAIISVLLVRTSGQLLAIPFSVVEHSVHVGPEEIRSAAGVEVVVLSGGEVPIVRLSDRLDLNFGTSSSVGKGAILVVVRHDEHLVALAVDSILGEEDVVVKSLPKTLQNIKGLSGVTTLGDGRTVLILDAHALLEAE